MVVQEILETQELKEMVEMLEIGGIKDKVELEETQEILVTRVMLEEQVELEILEMLEL
jgi:hypothetical protein